MFIWDRNQSTDLDSKSIELFLCDGRIHRQWANHHRQSKDFKMKAILKKSKQQNIALKDGGENRARLK